MLLFFKLKIFHHCILKIKKDILALGEDLTQGLDYATKIAEGKYYVSISRSERKSFLSLHDNGNSSFLFFNATKKYQFKLKKSEKNHIWNISKDFIANNMKKHKNKWIRIEVFC